MPESLLQRDLTDWVRALYKALGAERGHSFVTCLQEAENQMDGTLRFTLAAVREEVSQGNPLSRAMEQHPEVFSRTLVTVVRYGEMYGELDLTLRRYVEHPEDLAPRCGIKAV